MEPTHVGVRLYRKKPVVIEAMQLDGTSENGVEALRWIASEGGHVARSSRNEQRGEFYGLAIATLEGTMTAHPDDWIIRGVAGEFYPCKPDIFAATYDIFDPTFNPGEPTMPTMAENEPVETDRDATRATYVFSVAVTAASFGAVQDGMDLQDVVEMYRATVIGRFNGQNANRSVPVHYDVMVTEATRLTP